MCFFLTALPASTQDTRQRQLTGGALSDSIAKRFADEGFAPEFLYATGNEDGFPYTITLTLPKTIESFFRMDTLVVAASQNDVPVGLLVEFIALANQAERPVNIVFVLAANETSSINPNDQALLGSKKFLDTVLNPDSVCALILIPRDLRQSPPRLIAASSHEERITPTPLWMLKALPFRQYAPQLFYRLGLAASDSRTELFALNGIASAGIIFDANENSSLLFNGILDFASSMPTLDFSQSEGNYVSVRNPSSGDDFFFREHEYALGFLLSAVVSLLLFCAMPSVLNGIAFAVLTISCIEPEFLAPALILHLFFTLAHLSKKKARVAFLVINVVFAGLCFGGVMYITALTKQREPLQRIITPNDGAPAFLSVEQTSLLEHESVVITASAELPVIRCDIFVITPDENPLYSSVFPVSIDIETHTAHFELEEFPPNPLVVRYLTAKNQHSVVGADFFLDAGEEGIITKRVEFELPLSPRLAAGG
jgi:hypothetical protein